MRSARAKAGRSMGVDTGATDTTPGSISGSDCIARKDGIGLFDCETLGGLGDMISTRSTSYTVLRGRGYDMKAAGNQTTKKKGHG